MKQSSKIWVFVTFIHLVGLALISTASAPKLQKKRLMVVTKQVTPKPAVVIASHAKPMVISPAREVPYAPPKKIKQVKKQPIPTKALKPTKSSKQVLQKIDQRLAKNFPVPPPPKPHRPKEIEEELLPTYVDTACLVFRDLLVLPEKGIVKLTITVQPNGKIGKVETETFESKKNLDYLMTMLPTLSLPIPEGGKDATFTILFCNDDLVKQR